MKFVSANCGTPREVRWRGRTITTAIYKGPVGGRVALHKLNLDGDRAERARGLSIAIRPRITTTGGQNCPGASCPSASLERNFTIEELEDDSVHIGDRFSVGSAEVIATEPRLPCYKLGIRLEADDMVKRFLANRRMGFYLGVLREGELGGGDEITMISRDPNCVPVPGLHGSILTSDTPKTISRRFEK